MEIKKVKLVKATDADIAYMNARGSQDVDWYVKKDMEIYKLMHQEVPLSLIAVNKEPYIPKIATIPAGKYLYGQRIEVFPQSRDIPGCGAMTLAFLSKISKSKKLKGSVILDATLKSDPFYVKMGMLKVAPRTYVFTPRMAEAYQIWINGYLRNKNWESNPRREDNLMLYGDFSVNGGSPPSKKYQSNPEFDEVALYGDFTVGPSRK